MVYRGKPSSACAECRKRRTKCDKATPCTQCINTGRTCSGYRNTVDLLFRDESAKVVRKNKNKSQTPRSDNGPTDEVATQNLAWVHPATTVGYQPWVDVGINYFMSKFVGNVPHVSPFYYLPGFYSKGGYAVSSLRKTIAASGLVAYARETSRSDLLEPAARTYVGAIGDINTALSNPQGVVNDATLMSIIVAAVFESILVFRDSGMDNITRHLEGAMSVACVSLQQRRPGPVYKVLLSNLIQNVIMTSWVYHIPLPFRYRQLRLHLPEKINPHSVHAKLTSIIALMVDFREGLRNGHYLDSDAILKRALELDAMFKAFTEEMPNHTLYKICKLSATGAAELGHLVYNSVFHVYPEQFAGHFWNNFRSCRIYLHHMIRQQCSILLSSNTKTEDANLHLQRSASESLMILLAEEMCATVPQLLSYSDYLEQFVESTGYDLPTRTRAPTHEEIIVISSSSEHIETLSEDLESSDSMSDSGSSPQTTITESSSTCSNAAPYDDASKIPLFTHGPLDPASAFHLLYKLRSLTLIPCLPFTMKSWMHGRISWIESNSDAYHISRLKDMISKRPTDGFPVSDTPGQAPYGGVSKVIATTPADQRLWFLAHSWLFVGLDWDAGYLTSGDSSEYRNARPS